MQVRDETGKLEDLFFNIMKIAFPDIQFRESKDTLTFSGPGGPAGTVQSLKQVTVMQGKRHSQINKMEADLRPSKSMPRGTDDEEGRPRGYASKPGKEASFSTPSAGGREQGKPESGSLLAHPGDLVTCKKKRKDREKQRAGTTSPSSNLVRIGPLSPPPVAQVAYVPQSGPGHSGKAACQKDARPLQHSSIPARTGGSSVPEIKWAKPVKRTRTDTGKRRPSH
ncbi:ATP-dependent helicase BRM-like [Iris pallida]|uniref:ATP-dependent helicase BRM-like n=1 Tax=Iris pallida TaxID=29817 RepID=A0AAX6EH09_IRIPA|nr:ATP-dependent helicase BRM-like [Iris pallida]